MKKALSIILLGFLTLQVSAQLKKLTLEDAILKRWSSLRPEGLKGLSWVPEADGVFSYYSNKSDSLLQQTVGDGNPSTVISLEELNDALNLDLSRLPSFDWIDSQTLVFSKGHTYYTVGVQKKTGELLLRYPENATNLDFNKKARLLAYTIDNNLYIASKKDARIKVTDIEDPNIVSGQAIARSEFGITKGTFWSNDGSKLGFYQKDESDVHDYPLVDISTTPASQNSIKYPMAGQPSEHAKVGVFDVASNRVTYLQTKGDPEQYLTNFGWDPQHKHVYIAKVNRDQNHMWLNQYDAQTGKLVKTLFEERHEKWVEPEYAPYFLNDEEFLWYSERDGYMHLYKYNIEGELLGQVTSGDWVVLDILGTDKRGKTVFVYGTNKDGLERHAYAINLRRNTQQKLTSGSGVHRVDLSDNGKYLLDNFSNTETPRLIEVISTGGKKIRIVQKSENPLKNYATGTTEIGKLTAADGKTELNYRLIKPSTFDPRKRDYPVLVYVYGGPHAQLVTNSWLAGAPLWMHYQAEKGYIIFTVDGRGSANRGFQFENVIHRQLGTVELADQLEGVKFLKSLGYVDTSRMAIHGWSFGGFMTTLMMLRHPEVFQAGVAGGPVTDWEYYEVMYGERYMDRPEQNEEGYKTARLMNYVDKLKGDLLLIHGTSDPVVVPQHNYRLIKEFVDHGVQVDFFPYPQHPHNVRGKDRIHLMRKVLEYVDRALQVE